MKTDNTSDFSDFLAKFVDTTQITRYIGDVVDTQVTVGIRDLEYYLGHHLAEEIIQDPGFISLTYTTNSQVPMKLIVVVQDDA